MKMKVFILLSILIYCINCSYQWQVDNEQPNEDYIKKLNYIIRSEVNDDFVITKRNHNYAKMNRNYDLGKYSLNDDNQLEYCCQLGQIAGEKGYSCNAKFYSKKILYRNKNRAHNRKLGFYGREKNPHYGENIMKKFSLCVPNKALMFSSCCNIAAQVRATEPLRYNNYLRYSTDLRKY